MTNYDDPVPYVLPDEPDGLDDLFEEEEDVTNYYDSVHYVLPDEPYGLDDLFEEEEDDTPEISIRRVDFLEYNSCCIFFYALSIDTDDFDLMVRLSPAGVSWSIDEQSFVYAGLRELELLKWMLQVAELIVGNFDYYWTAHGHEWGIPQAPAGWKVVIS